MRGSVVRSKFVLFLDTFKVRRLIYLQEQRFLSTGDRGSQRNQLILQSFKLRDINSNPNCTSVFYLFTNKMD